MFSCLSGNYLLKCMLEMEKPLRGKSLLVWCMLSLMVLWGFAALVEE